MTGSRGDRKRAGPHRRAIHVEGTSSAPRNTAAELRSRQAELFSDDPEERRIGVRIHAAEFPVDFELKHSLFLSADGRGPDAVRGARVAWSADAGPSLRRWRWRARAPPAPGRFRRSRPTFRRWA